ncbi:hypothetical protein [Bradyrhizobium sp. S69]|uniref:hypothetical protein n=1 Tax=Bradyrhizobium sp. S69 TaxID=1641856 RepID=UPI00131ABD86|nr:hypothetical protein [Bradyrhizobium sp. S69]
MSARAPDSKKNFIAILSKATERRSVETPPQKSQAVSDRLVSRLLVGLMTALRSRAAKAG